MTRTASLPMYCLPEMAGANAAFWATLQHRLDDKGIGTGDVQWLGDEGGSAEAIAPGTVFSQMCGFPLVKRYRDQAIVLGTPHYAFEGCVGPTHRAFFMVRADDAAERLEDVRGRIFGCNSVSSNSGMNLPRLSLARIAGGRPFFSSVVMTGGHVRSLQCLDDRTVDVCSVDNVTWGFFKRFRPASAARFRVLEVTAPSPCLPFVASIATGQSEAAVIAETLHEMIVDPQNAAVQGGLELSGLSVPDVAAYQRLMEYEREAIDLGYPEIL
jgi:ABC-type phosphate/phosphonate transport system substrate-binding protein